MRQSLRELDKGRLPGGSEEEKEAGKLETLFQLSGIGKRKYWVRGK